MSANKEDRSAAKAPSADRAQLAATEQNVGEEQRPQAGWPEDLLAEYRFRFSALTNLASTMLGSRAEAEEVVQDAFIATARNWGSVEYVRPYVRRAVVNRTVDLQRRQTRRRKQPIDQPPDAAPQQLVEFRDLLLALPLRQRTVLVLRYLEDLPDREIAEIIGCRQTTVRSLAARGLAAIRKELA